MGYAQQFGVNTSLPGLAPSGGGLGSAAGGIAGGMIGGAVAGPPGAMFGSILGPLLAQFAGTMLSGLFGGGQTPYEQSAAQGLQARQGLIGQLQQQAAGQPTAGTRAAGRQLSQRMQGLQQSYAASAQRQGIAGTTPARAQQGRLQAAKLGGMANIMGASQISAQQQLGQLLGGAPEQQLKAETQRWQARSGFLSGIGNVMTEAKLQKSQGVLDARLEEIIQSLLDAIRGTQQSLAG